jgi:hypothetical protein
VIGYDFEIRGVETVCSSTCSSASLIDGLSD